MDFHVQNKCILRFKALFLAITDGTSQMILDFALLGEKGKSGNFGMSVKELNQRFTKEHDGQEALQERINEYTANKINLMIAMITRAISKGVKFRYVLADSWFACKDNRKLRCYYIVADVIFAETKVRLFALITTNTNLDFFAAYRIYSQRWSLEVVFKETKGLLGLGKCQANNFASQIAATSLNALQYNILSVVKRFAAYETIGKLFGTVYCGQNMGSSPRTDHSNSKPFRLGR